MKQKKSRRPLGYYLERAAALPLGFIVGAMRGVGFLGYMALNLVTIPVVWVLDKVSGVISIPVQIIWALISGCVTLGKLIKNFFSNHSIGTALLYSLGAIIGAAIIAALIAAVTAVLYAIILPITIVLNVGVTVWQLLKNTAIGLALAVTAPFIGFTEGLHGIKRAFFHPFAQRPAGENRFIDRIESLQQHFYIPQLTAQLRILIPVMRLEFNQARENGESLTFNTFNQIVLISLLRVLSPTVYTMIITQRRAAGAIVNTQGITQRISSLLPSMLPLTLNPSKEAQIAALDDSHPQKQALAEYEKLRDTINKDECIITRQGCLNIQDPLTVVINHKSNYVYNTTALLKWLETNDKIPGPQVSIVKRTIENVDGTTTEDRHWESKTENGKQVLQSKDGELTLFRGIPDTDDTRRLVALVTGLRENSMFPPVPQQQPGNQRPSYQPAVAQISGWI